MTRNRDRLRAARLPVRLMVLVLVATLAIPAMAAAQSPTDDQYDDVPPLTQTGGTSGDGAGGDGGSSLGSNVGPLPFTGFDLIAVVVVGLAVVSVGVGLQRAVAREPTSLR